MALSQSALSELLEASEVIGAGRYERTDERTTHRNGTRTRLLSTKAGDVKLHIPKLREGSFFPALLEPRRRIDRALWAVIMEAYVHGVSTRKVDNLVVALGIDAGVKKCEVLRICAELDSVVAGFRDRPLGHIAFPYVFLDATVAPRGATRPSGRQEPAASLSQQVGEAGGSLTPETQGRVGAAPTTTGRVGTARRRGSGKRDGKVQDV